MIQAGTTGTWNNVPMQVPAVVPSRLSGCNIINCNYVLKVHTSVSALFSVLSSWKRDTPRGGLLIIVQDMTTT